MINYLMNNTWLSDISLLRKMGMETYWKLFFQSDRQKVRSLLSYQNRLRFVVFSCPEFVRFFVFRIRCSFHEIKKKLMEFFVFRGWGSYAFSLLRVLLYSFCFQSKNWMTFGGHQAFCHEETSKSKPVLLRYTIL